MGNGDKELEALIAAVCGDDELQLEVGDALGRFRRRRDAAIIAQEAARLLPLGADIAAIRQRCHRSTIYRRARRAIVALRSHDATKP